ncbi:hypothetical protein CALVIDRAFT_567225 [Calocera viscosa TUFC12733]|uniref:Uncharacterized protein n=1 Tax=Calocera viscosa (strain TUFC12733) TaxID=1330018 RepID=A0A167IDP5_CALVF|nr:hypothetical protein CALVIDRAFT_567225 [Calocera viscosa TUFC12733]
MQNAVLAKLIEEDGPTEEDVGREREKAAFLDLTDRENVFFVYNRCHPAFGVSARS